MGTSNFLVPQEIFDDVLKQFQLEQLEVAAIIDRDQHITDASAMEKWFLNQASDQKYHGQVTASLIYTVS